MKKPLLFAILLIFNYSFGYSQSQIELLEKAYKENSLLLLDSFFTVWQNEIQPISEEELNAQNDTVKAIYKLFAYIYQPLDITRISDTNNISLAVSYTKSKYAVIQNSIAYRFIDKFVNPYDSSTRLDTVPDFSKGIYEQAHLDSVYISGSIESFRPYIKSILKPVYLNDKYEKIIVTFLVGNFPSHPNNILKERKLIMEDIEERYNFLNQMIEFTAPYYSGFTLIIWPRVSVIDFTIDFLKARIRYTIDWEHWLMFFEKSLGEWNYLNHKHHGSD